MLSSKSVLPGTERSLFLFALLLVGVWCKIKATGQLGPGFCSHYFQENIKEMPSFLPGWFSHSEKCSLRSCHENVCHQHPEPSHERSENNWGPVTEGKSGWLRM